jgi:hypothetical protein
VAITEVLDGGVHTSFSHEIAAGTSSVAYTPPVDAIACFIVCELLTFNEPHPAIVDPRMPDVALQASSSWRSVRPFEVLPLRFCHTATAAAVVVGSAA